MAGFFSIKLLIQQLKFLKKKLNMDEHVANVFESEVKAYQLVQQSSELKKITPDFFGMVTIDAIYSLEGKNVSEDFYLNKAYKMTYLNGEFIKLGEININEDEKCKLITNFNDVGINYIKDSSVIIDETNQIKYIIDFAEKEIELWW